MAEAVSTQVGINRREFLYYIWGASLALFTAELTGLIVWFMIPKFREGEFGGLIPVTLDAIPAVNAAPVAIDDGRFWLVNIDMSDTESPFLLLRDGDDGDTAPEAQRGLLAIYKVCTHLGCIYALTSANDRFECPCHGSKYRLDGRRIEDPAPRTLDRFSIILTDADGGVRKSPVIEDSRGDYFGPIELDANTVLIQVDTGDKKEGIAQTLLGELLE